MNEQQVGQEHGYIKAKDKEKLLNRLRCVEGQVRGVQRMIDEEVYCVDILTQISSYIAASEKVASLVLKDHMEHCERAALEDGTNEGGGEGAGASGGGGALYQARLGKLGPSAKTPPDERSCRNGEDHRVEGDEHDLRTLRT